MSLASLERFEEAVAKISGRAVRAAGALDQQQIRYEVVGGLAVWAWVADKDPGAARATRDVNIHVRPGDLHAATAAISSVGFEARNASAKVSLRDQDSRIRGDVELYGVDDVPSQGPRCPEGYRVAALDRLLAMKLRSFRTIDRVHVRDLLDVDAITSDIEATLPPDLLARLEELKRNPDG